jgi:hypothetical protein
MRSRALIALFSACIFAAPMLAGCDREVAHDETTKTKSDGTQVHKETNVKEKPDGTVVKTQEKSTDNPNNP